MIKSIFIVKYTSDALTSGFSKDTSSSQKILKEELNNALLMISWSMPDYKSGFFANCKFQKTKDPLTVFTGESYGYEVLEDGEVALTICVDKKTGLVVKQSLVENGSEKNQFMLMEYKTVGFEIPNYKAGTK